MLHHKSGKPTSYYDKGLDFDTEYIYTVRSMNSQSKLKDNELSHSLTDEHTFKTTPQTIPKSSEYPRCQPWLVKATGSSIEIAFLPPEDTGGISVDTLMYSVQMASERDPMSISLNELKTGALSVGNTASELTNEELKLRSDEMSAMSQEWQFKEVYNGKATGFIHFC